MPGTNISIYIREDDAVHARSIAFTSWPRFVDATIKVGNESVAFIVTQNAIERFAMALEKLRREFDIEARRLLNSPVAEDPKDAA